MTCTQNTGRECREEDCCLKKLKREEEKVMTIRSPFKIKCDVCKIESDHTLRHNQPNCDNCYHKLWNRIYEKLETKKMDHVLDSKKYLSSTKKPKKTRLVPFDWDRYQAGAKAVFRNYSLSIIKIVPNEGNKLFPYLYVAKDNLIEIYEADSITEKGYYLEDGYNKSDQDVLLEIEVEGKTIYVNVYPGKNCETLEEANIAKCYAEGCIGTLKVTYTDEDLIK